MDTKTYINELCDRLNWMQKDGINDLDQWRNVLTIELHKLVQTGIEEAYQKNIKNTKKDIEDEIDLAQKNIKESIDVLQDRTGIQEWVITIIRTDDGKNAEYFPKLFTVIGGIK